MPQRPQSVLSFGLNDLVEYRTGFQGTWRPGFIRTVERHSLVIEDFFSRRRVLIRLGQQGKIRPYSGPAMVDDVEGHRDKLRSLPPIRPVIVRTGGDPVPVPAPPPRTRCPRYLAFVRTFPCCNYGKKAPSEAHHIGERGVGQKADDLGAVWGPHEDLGAVPLCRDCHRGPLGVTDTNCLPGRSRVQTEAILVEHGRSLVLLWRTMQAT